MRKLQENIKLFSVCSQILLCPNLHFKDRKIVCKSLDSFLDVRQQRKRNAFRQMETLLLPHHLHSISCYSITVCKIQIQKKTFF